ncbi:MAG: CoB--CoM heterodisulfide reductase subunit C [Methanobacteriaceae archaeon]|jgi:heterodisulfide reductase subunit C|nr:CoB--CoM heterodisulfide reductase subunit C [Candidatus Methanorudis spinitermitis]
MSVLERLKAFLTGAKNDVSENKSDKEVLNQKKPEKTDDGLKSKQTSSKDTITEEKTDSPIAKTSESEETRVEEAVEETSESSNIDEKELEEDDNDKKDEKDNMTLLDEENGKLTLDSVDPDFTQIFIDAGIDTVEHCFQCGTCTGGCPSGRRTPYRIRQIVRKCLMGLKDEVISDPALWLCTTCYTCQERCPREIKIVEIVKMARNIAAENGFMAPAHKATGSFVIKTGHGVPINDATMELRKRVGLDELPPTTHSYPEALEEVQKICEATGFNGLIGFNKETGELE